MEKRHVKLIIVGAGSHLHEAAIAARVYAEYPHVSITIVERPKFCVTDRPDGIWGESPLSKAKDAIALTIKAKDYSEILNPKRNRTHFNNLSRHHNKKR